MRQNGPRRSGEGPRTEGEKKDKLLNERSENWPVKEEAILGQRIFLPRSPGPTAERRIEREEPYHSAHAARI